MIISDPREQAIVRVLVEDSGEWTTLNQVLALINTSHSEDLDRHIGAVPAGLVEKTQGFVQALLDRGYLELDEGGLIADSAFRLSRDGREALGGSDNSSLSGIGEKQIPTFDSTAWTGLSRTVVDARNAKVIRGLIDEALEALQDSGANNSEVMQAAAYLKAAKELVDAPEPPSVLIWQLISKAADLVGLLGLFYTIFSQASQ